MEEDFYASIKLKTGEEIFAVVSANFESDNKFLVINNPITICAHKNRSGESGYKVEPWLKTTTEDTFIIGIEDILTIVETNDEEIIDIHNNFVRSISYLKNNKTSLSRKMGYISSVNEAKKLLERIYRKY
jgi:hypothetical protein